MLKLFIYFTFFVSILPAHALRRDNEHFPILGSRAETLGSGNYSFMAYPGANGTSSVFTNAYMFGITDFFDFGLIPIFLGSGDTGLFNWNAKYQILRNSNHQISFTYNRIEFNQYDESRRSNYGNNDGAQSDMNSTVQFNKENYGLIYNYTPQKNKYNFAFNINIKQNTMLVEVAGKTDIMSSTSESTSIKVGEYPYKYKKENTDYYTDIFIESNYYLFKKTWIGLNLGYIQRDQLITSEEDQFSRQQMSIGSNIAYQGSIMNLHRLNLGYAYFVREELGSILFSADF